jgi:hypothetical protein
MTEPLAAQARPFQHLHAAHCESGVMASLLTHYGVPLSEPMAFGLGAGLAFAVLPFVKLAGQPLIAYRMPPRTIVKGLRSRLGVKMAFHTFRNPEAGMRALDERVDAGHPVGLQTNVYWLPFFPEEMRLHFNAHNLIVYGRRDDEYLISDPVFEAPVATDRASLQRARFAKGILAARGMMYYPTFVPERIDLPRALRSALRSNLRTMTGAPFPMIGIRGIRHLSRRLRKTAQRGSPRELKLLLGHVVRMQEEIGTGGAGFRFLYASFLQEASKLVGSDVLAAGSQRMTQAGDAWRRFALAATRLAKGRGEVGIDDVCKILEECADLEAEVWKGLRRFE